MSRCQPRTSWVRVAEGQTCGDCAHGDTNLSWSGNQAECEILALNREEGEGPSQGQTAERCRLHTGKVWGSSPALPCRDADLRIPCSKVHVQAGTNTAVLPSHPGPGTPPAAASWAGIDLRGRVTDPSLWQSLTYWSQLFFSVTLEFHVSITTLLMVSPLGSSWNLHVYGAWKTDCEPTCEQLSVNKKDDISQPHDRPTACSASSLIFCVGVSQQKRSPLPRFSFSVLWAVTSFAPQVFFYCYWWW